MENVKTDCILYGIKNEKGICRGLDDLYCCKGENCAFYKSRKEYAQDGSRLKQQE